jgi:hypothetical protein
MAAWEPLGPEPTIRRSNSGGADILWGVGAGAGIGAGKDSAQSSPKYVCRRHYTQRTERDHRKEEAFCDGFELGGVLRQGFALGNPQDCGFRFGDGV